MSERKVYEYKGQQYPSMRQLAKAAGIKYGPFKHRLERGWSIDSAVNTPVKEVRATNQRVRPTYWYKNKPYTLKSLPTTLSYDAMYYRIVTKGWSVKDAVELPYRSHPKKKPVVPKNWLHRPSMAGCEHTNFDFDTKTRRCRICGAGGGV